MRCGLIIFPGSNCDRDVLVALKNITKKKPKLLWHKDTDIENLDLIVIPGGFTFGDYLRCGALASNSPIIKSVKDHASRGGAILGICNGFQILTEAGLLPGTLIKNKNLKFLCKNVNIVVQNTLPSPFTYGLQPNSRINLPIAHNEGNYYIGDDELARLHYNGQIAFKYDKNSNFNGSKSNIAGILSKNGRILGMMPHPERSIFTYHNSIDGKLFFENLFSELLGL